MPPCFKFSENFVSSYGCKYDGIPLLKYYSKFVSSKPYGDSSLYLEFLIDLFRFDAEQIADILQMAADSPILYEEILSDSKDNSELVQKIEDEYNRIACDWANQNSEYIKSWKPQVGDGTPERIIKIDLLVSTAEHNPIYGSMRRALYQITNNYYEYYPKDIKFKPKFSTQNCDIEDTIKNTINTYSQMDTLAILGPPCNQDLEIVASKCFEEKNAFEYLQITENLFELQVLLNI